MAEKEYTLKELATLTQAEVVGDHSYIISGVADLESAGPSDASFLANPRYTDAMRRSGAGVVFISNGAEQPQGRNYLLCADPSRAFQQLLETFHADRLKQTGFEGIHPSAVIHETATVSLGAMVGPNAVIDAHTTIGSQTTIGAGCYIGPYVAIGKDCTIHPNVTIRERSVIGDRVIIQPGAIIGSCGFGLTTDTTGKHEKLSQIGFVRIENDVEIGANTTIDRARFKETVIGFGAKIDNLVQIGHGVKIGPHCVIVAQCGIAGSTELGKGVVLAGQVGVAGHIKIADGTLLAARSAVSKSLTKPGQAYGGAPTLPASEYHKNVVYLRNIESYVRQIKSLQKRVERLESY